MSERGNQLKQTPSVGVGITGYAPRSPGGPHIHSTSSVIMPAATAPAGPLLAPIVLQATLGGSSPIRPIPSAGGFELPLSGSQPPTSPALGPFRGAFQRFQSYPHLKCHSSFSWVIQQS
eukprot:GHVN01091262.1.p1 GENE.GHVN01091262.1~~GHVN01091262.1.p1  ORF type:complete len:119 (+),score=13.26 GHVN01091262.1:706-1062(+)